MSLIEIVAATVDDTRIITDLNEIQALREQGYPVRYLSRSEVAALHIQPERKQGQPPDTVLFVIDRSVVYRRWEPGPVEVKSALSAMQLGALWW